MESQIDTDIATLAIAMREALQDLIKEHDNSLDKRAAMQEVASPSLSREDGDLEFHFIIRSDRTIVASPDIYFVPEIYDPRDRRRRREISLVAIGECDCDWYDLRGQCAHTLAACWWLEEQLTRRSPRELEDFIASMTVDAVAMGRTLVDSLVKYADAVESAKAKVEDARIQWRVRVGGSNKFSMIVVVPYEQKLRKTGSGWTKGRELKLFEADEKDYLFRDPVDARVASLVARAPSAFGDQGYNLFEALVALAGHPNVAWNDPDATPVPIIRGELTLALVRSETPAPPAADPPAQEETLPDDPASAQPLKGGIAGKGKSSSKRSKTEKQSADALTPTAADEPPIDDTDLLDIATDLGDRPLDPAARYQPRLRVSGVDLDIDPRTCEIQLSNMAVHRPVVVMVPAKKDRIIVCELKDQWSAKFVDSLVRVDLQDVAFDAESASRLALSAGKLDPMLRVELPPELSGPIQDGLWELIVEMRPRATAGLHVALRMMEPRCPETLVPGASSAAGGELVRCHTPLGPIRLRRTLPAELRRAREVAVRFGLDDLTAEGPYSWAATSDDAALNLLGSLAEAGAEAPAILWPEGQTMKVRGELTPQSLRVKLDDRRDWFGISGSIEIDGREIALADLLVAVRENRNLVRVGDREFASISATFRRRLQMLDDSVVSERGMLRIADASAPMVRELLGEDVTLEAAARWHETLHRLDQIRDWNPSPPESLTAQLRDYQVEGYRWLARLSRWGVGSVLADDMGLGKTVQTLGVLIDRAEGGPALVVAPTSVGENWSRETSRFAPTLKPHAYREHDRQRLIDGAQAGDLIIVSYQLLQRDAERFASRKWHTLVLDEAQFIKNAATKTSQAIRAIHSDWRLGLSGTPLENHLGELWSLFRALSPGLLGSWDRFRTRFAEPIQRHQDQQRRESLAELVRPFILRRTKSAVLKELPERTEITLMAELGTEERERYEDARLTAVAELSGALPDAKGEGDQRFKTLAWLTKLRQLACHPRLVDKSWRKGSAKLRLLMETVEGLREEGHRALVFSQFVRHLDLVRAALDDRGFTYQYLDGSTPAAERQRRIDAFQNGEGELFLISLKAGGTGLNLTAANYVIHLDPWWNPAVEDQATDRAHRIGQERAVTVYRLVSKGTIEEQIIELHANKRQLVANVLGGTDQAGRLDTDELIHLIRSGAGSD